jgi:hypothetical protein
MRSKKQPSPLAQRLKAESSRLPPHLQIDQEELRSALQQGNLLSVASEVIARQMKERKSLFASDA